MYDKQTNMYDKQTNMYDKQTYDKQTCNEKHTNMYDKQTNMYDKQTNCIPVIPPEYSMFQEYYTTEAKWYTDINSTVAKTSDNGLHVGTSSGP